MKEYPTIDARLFIGMPVHPFNIPIFSASISKFITFTTIYLVLTGGSNVGVNPKINNMNPGYQAAKHEYVMISDSGIRSK